MLYFYLSALTVQYQQKKLSGLKASLICSYTIFNNFATDYNTIQMKALVTILISILFLQNLYSQSLTLSDSNGDIPNNSDVIYYGTPDESLVSHVFVANNNTMALDVKVIKKRDYVYSRSG